LPRHAKDTKWLLYLGMSEFLTLPTDLLPRKPRPLFEAKPNAVFEPAAHFDEDSFDGKLGKLQKAKRAKEPRANVAAAADVVDDFSAFIENKKADVARRRLLMKADDAVAEAGQGRWTDRTLAFAPFRNASLSADLSASRRRRSFSWARRAARSGASSKLAGSGLCYSTSTNSKRSTRAPPQ
jgi:hypothetical protein